MVRAVMRGWMAVRTIRHSSGRRYGLALAVFDGLLLPLLGLDMVILFLWALADKALASWRGLDGSMFRNLGEFALWAMLMGTTEDGFNRAPRTRDVAVARSKAQTAERDETTLGILYANASTNSGFLADQRLAGMEVLRRDRLPNDHRRDWPSPACVEATSAHPLSVFVEPPGDFRLTHCRLPRLG